MLIGIELRGDSILIQQLVVVRHLRIADHIFIAVIFFGDYPHVGGSGNILRDGELGEKKTRKYAQFRKHQ